MTACLSISPYGPDDAEPTHDVFLRAVRTTACHDYTPEQVAAWTSRAGDLDDWDARRHTTRTFVARRNGTVVGFTDLGRDGHIDMLFVAPEAGRTGVGTALLAHVRRLARADGRERLTVHASVTARPLFERHGFTVVETRRPVIDGVALTSHLMRWSAPIGSGPED